MKKLLCSLLILSIFILSSCNKGNPTTPLQPLLHKIIGQTGDSIGYLFFSYNSQHQLIVQEDSNNNGNKGKLFINYNTEGFPASTAYVNNNTYNGSWSTPDIDTFFYNANNQIIQSVYENMGIIQQAITTAYTYDLSGRLIADSTKPWAGDHYTYDGNDDCIMAISNSQYISDTITASYTKTTNLYIQNGLGIVGYITSSLGSTGIYGFSLYLSKHNTSQITYQDGSIETYTYQYDSNGLPLKAIIIYNDGSGSSQTATSQFFY